MKFNGEDKALLLVVRRSKVWKRRILEYDWSRAQDKSHAHVTGFWLKVTVLLENVCQNRSEHTPHEKI